MKYFAGVVSLFALLLLAATRAGAAECSGTAPFIEANALFTQAEAATGDKAHQLWDQGTKILEAHASDAPGGCDDWDEFDLLRLRALTHGLFVGYGWSGRDVVQARRDADVLWETTTFNAQRRRPYLDVEADMRKRWSSIYRDAARYREQLDVSARRELTLRHAPSGPGCAHPDMNAEAVDIVAPELPSSARYIGKTVVVLVAVTIDQKGKLAEARVLQSSGNKAVDDAAISAARKTTYVPKIVNCQSVMSTYIFRATFSPSG